MPDRTLVTGVDIIELERIASTVRRFGQRFLDRVYTEREQAYCRGRTPELAVRFAAKEAVSKALGCGLAFLADSQHMGVNPCDIEIVSLPGGRPFVTLSGLARERAEQQGLRGWSVSLSHARTVAVAFVIAYQGMKEERK